MGAISVARRSKLIVLGAIDRLGPRPGSYSSSSAAKIGKGRIFSAGARCPICSSKSAALWMKFRLTAAPIFLWSRNENASEVERERGALNSNIRRLKVRAPRFKCRLWQTQTTAIGGRFRNNPHATFLCAGSMGSTVLLDELLIHQPRFSAT